MSLTLRARLVLLGLLTAFGIGTLVFFVGSKARALEASLAASQVRTQAMFEHMDADMLHDGIDADVMHLLMAATPEERQEALGNIKNDTELVKERAHHAAALIPAGPLRAKFDEIATLFDEYAAIAQAMAAAPAADARARLHDFQVVFHKLQDKQDVASKELTDTGEIAKADVARSTSALNTVLYTVGFGVFVVVIAFLWIIARRARLSLTETSRVLDAVSCGDLQTRHVVDGNDEFAAMGRSLAATIEYLQGVAAAATALRRGDLSVRVEPRGPDDELAKSVNQVAVTIKLLVDRCAAMAGNLRRGDLAARADADGLDGAYAQLLAGMNGVVDAVAAPVREVRGVLERLADHDLTVRVSASFSGEFATMAAAVNSAATTLAENLGQVSLAAVDVNTSITDIVRSNQSVAHGASQQASSLEETAASIEELSVTTKQNAGNAFTASRLAGSARTSAEAGTASVAQMSEAMSRIHGAAAATSAIISDINELAFQTNLLSLNAAVEAARAGDAGRGFAVVAEEVRNLARRSKEAAKNTESLIRESMHLTAEGEDIARRVETTLTTINREVSQVSTLIADIASASDEQARGIEHLNRAVSQIDSLTQRAAQDAEGSARAAEQVANRAESLASLVGTYRLGDGGRPTYAPPPSSRRGGHSTRIPVLNAPIE
jgi:methyl-accepting chemotaxis protein